MGCDKFVLQAHLCTVWKNGQYKRTRELAEVKEGFEDQLKRLETNHVEIGMIHYVDSAEDWEKVKNGPIMRFWNIQRRNALPAEPVKKAVEVFKC